MPSKTPKQMKFFKAVLHAKRDPNYGDEHLRKVANSMPEDDIKKFANHLAEMKTKKAMLSILKELKEDIQIREPMYLDEVDEDQDEIDAVANEFHVKEDWSKYIKPYIGQPFSPKELQALTNFKEKKPITVSRTEIWFKSKDPFGISKTTVIKKLKDSGQLSFTSFQKQEKPQSEEEKQKEKEKEMGGLGGSPIPPPSGGLGVPIGGGLPALEEIDQQTSPGTANPPTTPADPNVLQQKQKAEEEDKKDITVTKSILFKDDIKGAGTMVDFLKELDL